MSPNVQAVIARILAREGGVADVGDGAGLTRWGQTDAWLKTYGLPTPQSPADATANHAKWMALQKLDQVCDVNIDLGDDVCDAAVNMGTVPAIEMLQGPLGVVADGVLGPETFAALTKVKDFHVLRCAIVGATAERYGAIITKTPSNAKFASGWMNRLAEKIRGLA